MPSDMKVVSQEELDAIDVNAPLPVLLKDSPIAKADPDRAKLLMAKLGRPSDVQQMNATEIQLILDEMVRLDIENHGVVQKETLEFKMKFDAVLSSVHRNLYGTKSTNVNVEAKLGHSQVASLMRKFADERRVVDITPDNTNGGEE